MPPAGLVLRFPSTPHASFLTSPKCCFNIKIQLSSRISKDAQFYIRLPQKNVWSTCGKGPHPQEALWHFLSVACHSGDSAGHSSFSMRPARPPRPGMCIIIQQVNKNIAIGNCKLAKSQKETNTNNRSGHARQRGEQRSRSQSSHLFCYCHSHSAPQCTSCPLH